MPGRGPGSGSVWLMSHSKPGAFIISMFAFLLRMFISQGQPEFGKT